MIQELSSLTPQAPCPAAKPLRLSAAARLWPEAGDVPKMMRWAKRGLRSPGGDRVYLKLIRNGGIWTIAREDLQEFNDAVTPPIGLSAASPRRSRQRNDGLRRRARSNHARAKAELAALGLLDDGEARG